MESKRGYQGFLILYSLWIAGAVTLMLNNDKFVLHEKLNRLHGPLVDELFKVITFLGDGWFVTILALSLLFYNYGTALLVGIGGILSGVSSQLLKRQVFAEFSRPAEYLDQMPDLIVVPLLDMKHYFSFPSGHSTAAFALLFALALLSKKWYTGVFLALLAVLIGYSRVFLSQHFLEDVVAGSLLGLLSAIVALFILSRISGDWMQRSLGDMFS